MRGVLARLAGVLIFQACFWTGRAILDAHEPRNVSTWTLAGYTAWLVAAYLAGMVAHELGHAAAVRLTGSRVDEIEFGGHWVRFRVRGVQVSAGLGLGGHVSFDSTRLGPRRLAVVLFAGPAANVLAAPLCFLLPVPRWDAAFIALSVFSSAAWDLVPDTDDLRTDGAKLTRIPATIRAQAAVRELVTTPDWAMQPGTADTLIEGFRLDVPEAEDILRELSHDPVRLLPFFRQDWTLPDKPEAEVLHIVDVLTWKTLCTSELPAETVELAASRAEWVLAHRPEDCDDKRIALHQLQPALALARLRQGRTADVRRLCAGALAADMEPQERASVLATVAMAKHARLLSGQAELDAALALDPDAPLVPEALATLSNAPALLTADAATR
jgi:hypothetical protein